MLAPELVPDLVDKFRLGDSGTLSAGPAARGRQGDIWRLDTDTGQWAVKIIPADVSEESVADSAAFQEAAIAAGVPAPPVIRTTSGQVLAQLPGGQVRVYGWVDLLETDTTIDPRAVGSLIAALHRVDIEVSDARDPWFTEPVGEDRWRQLIADLRAGGSPFVTELESWVPELVAMEGLLGEPPRTERTCHRDLWADNLRFTPSGELCVFDFENCGPADPGQELAMALFEFASWDPKRARAMKAAYAAAGGDGVVDDVRDFAMAIAVQGHITEIGCRRWLAATTDEERADNETWVREFIDRPMTRQVIDTLLRA